MLIRRSIIIGKKTTSISLEESFWRELDRIAEEHELEWQDFLRIILKERPAPTNRSAAIKEAILTIVKEEADNMARVLTSWWQVEPKGQSSSVIRTRGSRVLAGRSSSCEIHLNDKEVSRQHALLAWDNRHWWVVDLNSKNGTYVGGKKIAVARLRTREAFQVGGTSVAFLRQDA